MGWWWLSLSVVGFGQAQGCSAGYEVFVVGGVAEGHVAFYQSMVVGFLPVRDPAPGSEGVAGVGGSLESDLEAAGFKPVDAELGGHHFGEEGEGHHAVGDNASEGALGGEIFVEVDGVEVAGGVAVASDLVVGDGLLDGGKVSIVLVEDTWIRPPRGT